MSEETAVHSGGCHCGNIRFEVDAPADLSLSECNCSICRMNGYLHLIVRQDQFRLLKGREHLATYRFNTGVAKHSFCDTCGIKSFYVPRSHPDGISVNARCIDPGSVNSVSIRKFDGQHWEANADQLDALGQR